VRVFIAWEYTTDRVDGPQKQILQAAYRLLAIPQTVVRPPQN